MKRREEVLKGLLGRFTNWCLFELRRCLLRYSIDECVSTADGTTDCYGAKKGPKNSYEYLNDDDDAMEFLSALSSGMPLSLFWSPHSKRSPFPEI